MGGVATLAKQLGFQITGSDQNVYPPMSTLLEQQGIGLKHGYSVENLTPTPDLAVIGNVLSRGNPEVEAILDRDIPYTSGPGWLSDHLLRDRWILAVAGTHGKTTTSSLLAWILEDNGMEPGFLIGGVPNNFGLSARLGKSPYFVVEADEYDTAFFDKRSKFVHYRPRTVVLNNLEYDHADIFPDLAAIKTQFHHLVRTIPGNGLIIMPGNDANLTDVLEMGCWTPVERIAFNIENESEWTGRLISPESWHFDVYRKDKKLETVNWDLTGSHNVYNALTAIAAANHVGIEPQDAIRSLRRFKGIKRRMEIIAQINNITLYDDFAHHPTAISLTLEGLRRQVGANRIIAVVEPRSNTMRMGIHGNSLPESFESADLSFLLQPNEMQWDIGKIADSAKNISVFHSIDELLNRLMQELRPGDHLVFMSNGNFSGIQRRLAEKLRENLK